MNIVITGGNGVMGRALHEHLPEARFLSRADCDVRDALRVSTVFRAYRPDVVLHAAALTDHQHPDAAEIIETNIEGTRIVAQWCRAHYVRLVYLSTHYVYGGAAPTGGYTELADTRPIGTYAWAKLAGERWVDALVPEHTIVRGSWYTPAKARGWAERGALVDAWHNREPVTDAARKIAALTLTPVRGVVNIGGRRETFHDTARRTLPGEPVMACELEDFDVLGSKPYVFPRDTTVNTARWDALAP